ncbi:antimicrobial peptide ABC transporter permease [Streptococcus porcinus]|uniref:FtsX-like permease family protein n=1 Tax=Streptococcus porcinus TaxID=1340 RepID=UPI0010CAC46F|nr:FtsX-like permease family protein [Streptococcus porcinus]VTS17087.1 antimicrobial peptide ABC transporter permease [Streptococcus porcinus]
MTLFDFAYKNISRDFKTYIYHFLSCSFSVFVFFIFTNLAFHPALKTVDENSSLGLVLSLGLTVSIIFSFVFILYSISNFLKQRSKQFAILNIIGASNKQFKRIVFYENVIISVLALLAGSFLGLVFSKFFLMIAESVIGDLNLYFYIPIKSFMVTLVLMGGLFTLVSLVAPIILRKKKIIELLNKEDEAEKSYILIVSMVLVIVLPITVYLHIKLDSYVYPMYLVTAILLIYFLFNTIFVLYSFIMNVTNKRFRGNGLVKVTNFKYNIHTNLKTMTINMILFSIVLSSLVIIVGAPNNVSEVTEKIMPYSYMYTAWDKKVEESKQVQAISGVLKTKKDYQSLKIEFSNLNAITRDVILSHSTYNEIAKFLGRKSVKLNNNQYFLVGVDGKHTPKLGKLLRKELRKEGLVKNKGTDKRVIALSGYFTSVTVVSDVTYKKMSQNLKKETIYAFNIDDWKNAKKEEKELKKLVKLDGKTESLSSAYAYYQTEKLQRSILSYVGSILCISFLIGVASITYSRLYLSSDIDIKKYKMMSKLGIETKFIKKSLSATLIWVFVLPFVLSLFVAWYFIYSLDQFTLVSYIGVLKKCSIIYCIVELLLYFLINRKYQKMILDGVFE